MLFVDLSIGFCTRFSDYLYILMIIHFLVIKLSCYLFLLFFSSFFGGWGWGGGGGGEGEDDECSRARV